jgi:hypothetical protein
MQRFVEGTGLLLLPTGAATSMINASFLGLSGKLAVPKVPM